MYCKILYDIKKGLLERGENRYITANILFPRTQAQYYDRG